MSLIKYELQLESDDCGPATGKSSKGSDIITDALLLCEILAKWEQ